MSRNKASRRPVFILAGSGKNQRLVSNKDQPNDFRIPDSPGTTVMRKKHQDYSFTPLELEAIQDGTYYARLQTD